MKMQSQTDDQGQKLPNIEELTELPGMLALFRKAAGKSNKFADGQSLPMLGSSIHGLKIDRRHLLAYQKLMGFDENESLPPTYLSMLGFPLVLNIMTHADFPMKAMGQVHLRNEITVLKYFPIGAPIDLTAYIKGNTPTSKGIEWSVGMMAKVNGELVWSSESTMLHRCKTTIPRQTAEPIMRSGEVQTWSVDGGMGRRYAKVSGDYNPIHLSAMTAKFFGFKRAIVHGMWSKARSLAVLKNDLP
ncbi:MAG: acyl dehydratase, partial [Porticoccaceae bacterium]|nr:acyl dehydratase [Porticoccaceae bacterium]